MFRKGSDNTVANTNKLIKRVQSQLISSNPKRTYTDFSYLRESYVPYNGLYKFGNTDPATSVVLTNTNDNNQTVKVAITYQDSYIPVYVSVSKLWAHGKFRFNYNSEDKSAEIDYSPINDPAYWIL